MVKIQKISLLLILLLSFSTNFSAVAQLGFKGPVYGGSIGALYSGSGYGLLNSINFIVDEDPQALSAGLLFSPLHTTFNGADVKYKYYFDQLTFFKRKKFYKKGLSNAPFLFVNIRYLMAKVKTTENVFNDIGILEETEVKKLSESFALYLGGGIKFYFRNRVYFDLLMGFGGYVSSMNESLHNKEVGEHYDNQGVGLNFEFNVGYTF